MNAVPSDTLRMAQRLEAAGFPPGQAAGASEALAEALVGADLATKSELYATKSELRAEMAALRTELKAEIAELRTELRTEIGSVRGAIELLRRDMTIRLGSMIFVAVGVIIAAMRLMSPYM